MTMLAFDIGYNSSMYGDYGVKWVLMVGFPYAI